LLTKTGDRPQGKNEVQHRSERRGTEVRTINRLWGGERESTVEAKPLQMDIIKGYG